ASSTCAASPRLLPRVQITASAPRSASATAAASVASPTTASKPRARRASAESLRRASTRGRQPCDGAAATTSAPVPEVPPSTASTGPSVIASPPALGALVRGGEAELRPVVGQAGQLPARAGQQDRRLVAVVGDAGLVLRDEALQHRRILRDDPARHLEGRRF